jgi:hypothetical protein
VEEGGVGVEDGGVEDGGVEEGGVGVEDGGVEEGGVGVEEDVSESVFSLLDSLDFSAVSPSPDVDITNEDDEQHKSKSTITAMCCGSILYIIYKLF